MCRNSSLVQKDRARNTRAGSALSSLPFSTILVAQWRPSMAVSAAAAVAAAARVPSTVEEEEEARVPATEEEARATLLAKCVKRPEKEPVHRACCAV